jgi:AcrR family transcriptional regulator
MPTTTGLRARVRAELIVEIKEEARRQLSVEGAPGLSLRAITRALGMASSGIYRYFKSRDELLTALIVDGYDSIGQAAEVADGGCPRNDFGARWQAASYSIRDWAGAHPHEYALVYGSPVPGYRAPRDTIGPASRVTSVLAAIVHDASLAGALSARQGQSPLPPLSREVAIEARRLVELAFPDVAEDTALRAVAAWTQLFGIISFELFGHFHGVIGDPGSVFDRTVLEMGAFVGLPVPYTQVTPGTTATDEHDEGEDWYLI